MAQSIYYVNKNANQYGTIALEMSVFESIANNILSETPGVVLDIKRFTNNSAVAFLDNDDLIVTVNIKIKYGTIVSKTSKDVQNKINESITELTNVEPKTVNINVVGIEF